MLGGMRSSGQFERLDEDASCPALRSVSTRALIRRQAWRNNHVIPPFQNPLKQP